MNQESSNSHSFTINNFEETKQKVLNWLKRFDTFCFLDNHQYQLEPHSIECLVGAGVKRKLVVNAGNALEQLQFFMERSDGDRQTGAWVFGHLGYDLKNEIEDLVSSHPDHVNFPDLFFYEPEIVIRLNEQKLIVESGDAEEIYRDIQSTTISQVDQSQKAIAIQSRFTKEEYISTVNKLRDHILRGDCYEINFCQEFFAPGVKVDPLLVYQQLSQLSPNPFSALYRQGEHWLLCASPERFLKKNGRNILSQPIKGTSKRMINDPIGDAGMKKELFNSAKDRSENVMVVDLVRNDLSKICAEGSVSVDELFGIYSFPQVHQMISTVSGLLRENISFSEMIRAIFPMGSMTGAPKKRVMELIERYEKTKRGIFSGAVGYISPGEDFDFNVVIRSIMYNEESGYLSYQVGSGITFYSEAEKEWEECILKAEAIQKVLARSDFRPQI